MVWYGGWYMIGYLPVRLLLQRRGDTYIVDLDSRISLDSALVRERKRGLVSTAWYIAYVAYLVR